MGSLIDTIRGGYDIEGQVLTNLGLLPYPMYIRTVSASGADENLGVKGTETVIDTLIVPNPEVKNVSLFLVNKSNGLIELGDIIARVSAINVTKAQLETADFIKYQDRLWKIIRVDGEPDLSMPFRWVTLLRKHRDV